MIRLMINASLRNHHRIRLICAFFCSALILISCTSKPNDLPPSLSGGATGAYKLSVGDRLRIAVFGHPEHTGEFQIDSSGNINFPLLGEVNASGHTVSTLKGDIRSKLDENYIVNPRLSVEVLTYRPFFILGEINNAGKYDYEPNLTVRQAIAIAGGLTRRAATDGVTLLRPTEDGMKSYDVKLGTKILPGDTIQVRRRFF